MRCMIDLRSDTVTRPTARMREAMAAAEVGDDVYGEDPTVNALQDEGAALLGFEAALWIPTGTMGNAIAIRIQTRPGDEVLAEERSHVVQYELAGMAALSGVIPRVVRSPDGHLTPEIVNAALRPAAYLRSDLALAVLENTHNLAGGTVCTLDRTRDVIAACRTAGLAVHIDGARVWNAATALGVEPAALLAGADTAMVALSKGLCAPAGSLLLGSAALMAQARRVRKQLGGGMRQVGILAAAGRLALGEMRGRLAEDHASAGVLAAALARCAGVEVQPVATNIVVARLRGTSAPEAVSRLREKDVAAVAVDASTLRLVTHRDVSSADCARAALALVSVLA
jgi:threonine aldolase